MTPKYSKYMCKNELIYIRDSEAVQKPHIRVLSGLKLSTSQQLFLKYISIKYNYNNNITKMGVLVQGSPMPVTIILQHKIKVALTRIKND